MINQNNKNLLNHLAIILSGALLFLPFLGHVALFDWDEVNFAEIAREMIVTKDYLNVQVNYLPFWEKPPLFIWMQVISMKLFGVNEFAARFPNAVCGIITLLVIYSIGKKLFNQKMGLIWVGVYASSILPFFYFKSGIIDPWFNLFIFLGIFFAARYIESSRVPEFQGSRVPGFQSSRVPGFQGSRVSMSIGSVVDDAVSQSPGLLIFLSGLFIGLAILTKGPVALLIFGLVALIYLLLTLLPSYFPNVLKSYRPKVRIKLIHILLFFAGLILTGGSWFMLMIAAGHLDVVKDFIIYQVRLFSTKDAGHGGFPGYHIVILLLGVFPASAFLFGGWKASPQENPLQKEFRRIAVILLLTVIILFEIVQTKIVHYSSLAYFPLTYLSSLYIFKISEEKKTISKSAAIILITLALIWIFIIIGFTLVGLNKEWLISSGLIRDPFANANLAADIRWTGWEIMVALPLLAGLLAFLILKQPFRKIMAVFAGSMIFTFLTMTVFTGKIEGYAQSAPIEFYSQKAGEDCYIKTLGYKSYAHMFYGKTMPQNNPLANDNDWLLNGKIDKTAYFVFKMTKKEEYARIYPQLTILYEKNGFIFAARYPEKTNTGL